MGSKMKYALAIVAALTATSSYADNVRNVNVQDVYSTITQSERHVVQVCDRVQGDAGSGALAGMIIGGIIGKGLTGTDGGATAGAVMGGVIGADNANNSTTRCHDEVVYTDIPQQVYSHSVITFSYQGRSYALNFNK